MRNDADDAMPDLRRLDDVRPFALASTGITGVLASGAVGAATNGINGVVSPDYFVTFMHLHGGEDVWRASIAQGIFEGLCFGLVFSLAFTAGAGIITRASCTFEFALRHLLGIVAGALVCWIIGGTAGVLLAWVSPDFYRNAIIGVPEEFEPMLAYAWVGGSIAGVQFGGLPAVILGLVVLRANWLREPINPYRQ